MQLRRVTDCERLRLIACRAQADVLIEIVVLLAFHDGTCRGPHRPSVAPVHSQNAGPPDNVHANLAEPEAARVDRLLAVTDYEEVSMVFALVEREEQAHPSAQVLCFVDDDSVIPWASSALGEFECFEPNVRQS